MVVVVVVVVAADEECRHRCGIAGHRFLRTRLNTTNTHNINTQHMHITNGAAK